MKKILILLAFLFPLAAQAQIGRTNVPANVTLAWDPSPGPDVVAYTIYYGIASGVYTNKVVVGNVTNASVLNLVRGVTYYFVATASDATGLESDYSNEVSYTPRRLPGPPRIKTATVFLSNGAIVVLTGDGQPVQSYQIEAAPGPAGEWKAQGETATDSSGVFQYSEPFSNSVPARFYRAK